MPLVLPCLAILLGIVSDAVLCWPQSVWVCWSGVALAVFVLADWCRWSVLSRIAVCLAASGLGSARHHQSWSLGAADHISHKLMEAAQPCRIVGRVISQPVAFARPAAGQRRWAESEWWRCEVRVEWIGDARNLEPVRGDLELRGVQKSPLCVGDRVDAYGRLSLPPAARNPGGFDARTAYRRRGISAIVRVSYPGCLGVIGTSGHPIDVWIQSLNRLRA
ncbi:MAG: ComEC/Rec2 family competence protein, partial [Planctomycetaceae bacterium]